MSGIAFGNSNPRSGTAKSAPSQGPAIAFGDTNPSYLRPMSTLSSWLYEQQVDQPTEQEASETPFAVFAVAKVGSGAYAATTRPADRGQAGKIGLPGGKLDPGEDPIEAVERECREEGWDITIRDKEPIQKLRVDGNMVWWYRAAPNPRMLTDYKEKHRIVPVIVSRDAVVTSGYGNEYLDQ